MITKSLPRLLLGAAVVGASSLSLSAGGAKAVLLCSFPTCAPGSTASLGDKIITVINGPNVGSGDVEFQWDPLLPGDLDDLYTVDVDFTTDLIGPVNGSFRYKLAIDQTIKPYTFRTVNLNWDDFGTPGVTVTKNVYNTSSFDPANLIESLTTANQTVDISSLSLKEIWVDDVYTIANGSGVLDNFTNAYTQQVPGPLPLLGAGTAFGFSRRLRRRAKARVSLG
jgi:hypothetical protein